LDGYARIAQDAGCSMAQLSLAWVLSRGDHVVALPGTTSVAHLEENLGARAFTLSAATLQRLDALINRHNVSGARYNPATQAEVDTEEFG
jgi:aryl-alcohol dehydrogenase-like predicted oxidoreductase